MDEDGVVFSCNILTYLAIFGNIGVKRCGWRWFLLFCQTSQHWLCSIDLTIAHFPLCHQLLMNKTFLFHIFSTGVCLHHKLSMKTIFLLTLADQKFYSNSAYNCSKPWMTKWFTPPYDEKVYRYVFLSFFWIQNKLDIIITLKALVLLQLFLYGMHFQ